MDLGVKVTLKLVSKLLTVAVIAFLLGFVLGYEIGKESYTIESYTNNIPASLLSTLTMNETIEAGIWRIGILSVEESLCMKYQYYGGWEYYQAPKGMKVIIVGALVENKGFEDSAPFSVIEPPGPGQFSLPTLITNTGKRYKAVTEYDIRGGTLIKVYVLDEEILKCAIPFKGSFGIVPVSESDERNFMYLVPENEEPIKLVMVYQPTLNKPPITFEVSIRRK
jgi:hypothetical protein